MAKEALELGKANQQSIADHLVECTETRAEIRAAQTATDQKVDSLLKMQHTQSATLDQVSDVLPWLRQSYENKRARDRAWKAVGDFVLGMARKNWDSISGKLIFIAIAAYLSWKGVPWTEVVKALAP